MCFDYKSNINIIKFCRPTDSAFNIVWQQSPLLRSNLDLEYIVFSL